MVKYNRRHVYLVAIFLFLISTIGALKIKTSGSLIEDMPKNTGFYQDILFFEKNLKELCRWKLQSIPKEKRGNETTYLEKDG
jgi:predicted RND superfamily exporter protein